MEEKRRFTGRTEEEALERAERILGLTRDALTFEVVSRSKGLMAMVKPAVVIEVSVPMSDGAGFVEPPAPRSRSTAAPRNTAAPRSRSAAPARVERDNGNDEEQETPPVDPEAYAKRLEHTRRVVAELLPRLGYPSEALEVRDASTEIVMAAGAEGDGFMQEDRETLEAFQFVVNKIVNRFPPRWKISLEGLHGGNDEKDEELARKARNWIQRVEETGKEYWVSRLNSRERRVVHMEVSQNPKVASRSEGEGRERRLCIYKVED